MMDTTQQVLLFSVQQKTKTKNLLDTESPTVVYTCIWFMRSSVKITTTTTINSRRNSNEQKKKRKKIPHIVHFLSFIDFYSAS